MTNSIKLTIYGVASIATLSLMMFVVLPQLPQVNSNSSDSVGIQALSVFAFGQSGDGGCCGGESGGTGGESGGGGTGGESRDTPIPAVCNYLTASPTTLPYGGGTVTLSWSTSNATYIEINNGVGMQHAESGSRSVSVTSDTTFTLTALGTGGNATCTATVTVSPPPPPAPAAVCSYFDVSPNTVPYGGGNVTITWNTQNATSVSIDNGVGTVSANGSNTVFVSSNTTFRLTAIGAGGNDTHCVDSVTVQAAPPQAPAFCDSFTADKTTVPHNGGTVTLTWATRYATSVSIDNGVGNVALNGSKNVFVSSTVTYTLTAVGAGGNDTCTVTITVGTPPVTHVATCDSFTADRYNVPYNGGNVVLSWATTNATSVSIDNGVGNVSVDGSKNVFVNSTVTFTLTAVGTGGNDTCTVTITKGTAQAPICNYLRVDGDDNNIEEGDNVTIEWSTTNATDVTISPDIGSVSANGSRTVEIDDDITYTLTARNAAGNESTCTLRIEIEEEEEDDKKTPRCELDISKDRVKRGEKVTLSWETTNVDEIVIKDDRGNTIFDTDDYSSSKRKKYFDGEIDVIINQSTEFILKAQGVDGGSRTCKVDVEVDDIAVYEKRDQALVIALTQVPYTGFEAGAFLTFLFYAVLTLWALFIAYILVVKKGSVLGFSLYGAGVGMSETDVENRKKVEALVAKYSGLHQK